MSRNTIFLRVQGYLDDVEGLVRAIGIPATVTHRGSQNVIGKVQPIDVILFQLAAWSGVSAEDQDKAEQEQLLPVATKLQQLAPVLASLDRSRCTAELYVSSIRTEEQGGIEFPPELIAAVGKAKLSIGISILVLLDDD